MNILFLVALPLDSWTGGSLYERRLVEELQSRGHRVQTHSVGAHPPPEDVLARSGVLLWDGMSLLAAADRWGELPRLGPSLAIVHSPFAEPWTRDEPWLPEPASGDLAALERSLFARMDHIAVPSPRVLQLLTESPGRRPGRM